MDIDKNSGAKGISVQAKAGDAEVAPNARAGGAGGGSARRADAT